MGLSPDIVYVAFMIFVTVTDVNFGCDNDNKHGSWVPLFSQTVVNDYKCRISDISSSLEEP